MNSLQVFFYVLAGLYGMKLMLMAYDFYVFFRDLDQDVSSDVVGFAEEPITNIEVDFQSEPVQTKKVKKKKKSTPQPTNMTYVSEAVEALKGLGIKKSKASSIIQDLCSRKRFASTEELVKAAILCI